MALIVGLVAIAAYVSIMLILIDTTSFDVWGAVLLVPILIGLSVPVLRRQAIRESDPGTFRLLFLALIVKLAGAVARYYVAFSVYGGAADAARYHRAGVELAGGFRHLDFAGVHLRTGTSFIENITGLVYALIGPSKMGGFVFFSWLGFWGLFLFYRAFTIAVPVGRRRSYALLLFFLPSLVFWPSSIGKEAWMMFCPRDRRVRGGEDPHVRHVVRDPLLRGRALAGRDGAPAHGSAGRGVARRCGGDA